MTTNTKPQLRKPSGMNLAKGKKVVSRVIKDNQTWLKEMADK